MVVKVALLVIFFAVTILIGVLYKKKVKTMNDFVLGGRNMGPWITAFAYGTSYFSAVIFVGYAGTFGWRFGISAFWIGIGNALIGSLLAWLVLGRRTRILTKHLDSATMPDFFGKRYDSKLLKILSSVIVFVFLVPYSASVYKGLSGIFSITLDIPFEYCIIGMAVLTAIYVVLGGYMATALNSFIQGVIMLVGIVLVVIAVLSGHGGFSDSIALLSQEAVPAGATGEGIQGAYVSFFGPDLFNLIGVVILTSLGTWGLPQMIHKFYTIKDEKAITKGAIISTIFAFVVGGGSYFIGGFGRLFVEANEAGGPSVGYDNVVPTMLMNLEGTMGKTLLDLLLGIVIVLILSASMSTLSSIVISSASTFTLDFLKGTFLKKISEKTSMLLIRILCIAFVAASVILAMNAQYITNLMGISWGALSGAFLAPFLYGLYWKRTNKWGVLAGFVSGIGIVTANMLLNNVVESSVAGALAMFAGLIVVPVVSLITPKPEKKLVEDCFACYDSKVEVQAKYALGEEEK